MIMILRNSLTVITVYYLIESIVVSTVSAKSRLTHESYLVLLVFKVQVS